MLISYYEIIKVQQESENNENTTGYESKTLFLKRNHTHKQILWVWFFLNPSNIRMASQLLHNPFQTILY